MDTVLVAHVGGVRQAGEDRLQLCRALIDAQLKLVARLAERLRIGLHLGQQTFLLGHVVPGGHHAGDHAVGDQRGGRRQDKLLSPLRVPQAIAHANHILALEGACGGEFLRGQGAPIRVADGHNLRQLLPSRRALERLGGVQAAGGHGGGVSADANSRGIINEHRVKHALQHPKRACLLEAQGLGGPLSLRAGDSLPFPGALEQGKLMVGHDVQDFRHATFLERIGAEGQHPVLAEDSVNCGFVGKELLPVGGLEPEGVARKAQAIEASLQGLLLPLDPAGEYPVRVEVSAKGVPFAVVEDLDLATLDITLEPLHGLRQGLSGFVRLNRLGGDPHAILIGFQAGLEIGDENVKQILVRLVKEAEVGAPGDFADRFAPGLPVARRQIVFLRYPPCRLLKRRRTVKAVFQRCHGVRLLA